MASFCLRLVCLGGKHRFGKSSLLAKSALCMGAISYYIIISLRHDATIGKHQSGPLKFDRGTLLVGMKGKGWGMPCFLFPQAPQPSSLLKWHHLWLPNDRRRKSCGGVTLSESDTTQTSLTWRIWKEINNASSREWRQCRTLSTYLNLHCLKHLQDNWCFRTNPMNFLAVSVIKLVVLCCQRFASGTGKDVRFQTQNAMQPLISGDQLVGECMFVHSCLFPKESCGRTNAIMCSNVNLQAIKIHNGFNSYSTEMRHDATIMVTTSGIPLQPISTNFLKAETKHCAAGCSNVVHENNKAPQSLCWSIVNPGAKTNPRIKMNRL